MDLEREFISSLLTKPSLLSETKIAPEDLTDDSFANAYRCALSMMRNGQTPDVYVVADKTGDRSLYTIHEPCSQNFEYIEGELAKQIERRRLESFALKLEALIQSGDDPADVLKAIDPMINSIRVERGHSEITTLFEDAKAFGPVFEERFKSNGKLVGIPTGFRSLDAQLGGFQVGSHYIVARPSQGKTAMLLTHMMAALRAGHSAGFISVESPKNAIISRIIAADAPVNGMVLKTGVARPSDMGRIRDAFNRTEVYKGYTFFSTQCTVEKLDTIVRRMVTVYGVEIVFIDYLQRLKAPGGSRTEQVTAASMEVCDLPLRYNIPVVCGAQRARPPSGVHVDSWAPDLSQIQHSSQAEQDGDVIMFITHKTEEDMDGKEYTDSHIHVLKDRDGETGYYPVYFAKENVRFTERTT